MLGCEWNWEVGSNLCDFANVLISLHNALDSCDWKFGLYQHIAGSSACEGV
jgi:hypothetical protein